jgi:SOS-response transcriptional repressor LexA
MTSRQWHLLNFITSFVAQHGFSPSYAEICAGIGSKSRSNVHNAVAILRRDGFVNWEGRYQHRSLFVTEAGLAKIGKAAPTDHVAVAALSDDALSFLAIQVQTEIARRVAG